MIYSNQKNLKIHACCIIDCRITCMVCLILRYKVITSYWRRNSNKASAPIIMTTQKYFLNINQESNSSDMLTSACLPECVEMIEKNLALVLSKPCPCLIQSLMSWLEKKKIHAYSNSDHHWLARDKARYTRTLHTLLKNYFAMITKGWGKFCPIVLKESVCF